MKLLLIGTDRGIFAKGTKVRERLTRLGAHLESLQSIVFSRLGYPSCEELAPTSHAYATNSHSRLLYGWDALRIARTLEKPDIVSAQDPFETGLAALFISRHFGVPLAVEVHTDFLTPAFAQHSLLNWLRVHLADYVLRHANGGYAVSQKICDAIQAKYGLKLEVLPIYTDTSRYTSLVHEPHPRFKTALLWVGRMEPEKDPLLALNACINALMKGYEIGITFVGEGSLRVALKKAAADAGMEEWVEFTGVVSDPTPYYAYADLLLVTSHYEGYGMVIAEALAAGVPVLSTDVGISREAGAIVVEVSKQVSVQSQKKNLQKAFGEALCTWLDGRRERSKLQLETYASEDAYLNAVVECYTKI